jgi:hyperosmotically inducible protein
MRSKLILATMVVLGTLEAKVATTDAALASQVTQKLRDANFDSILVDVNDRVATLTGAVDRVAKAERAARLANKVDGVSGVANRIEVRSARTDAEIAADLTHEIRMFPFYSIFDLVTGEVKDGMLTLRGAVRLPVRFQDYENLAKQVAGVKAVKNELEVLPTSAFDDQIRLRVARAIYGSALGPRYGLQARPPIHVIVKNGNVRLEGAVATELDKTLADRAARFAATYFNLENNLKVVKG